MNGYDKLELIEMAEATGLEFEWGERLTEPTYGYDDMSVEVRPCGQCIWTKEEDSAFK